MKARALLKSEILEPETLKVVFEAFDMASAEMEAEFPEGHDLRDAARQRLATLMLSFATKATCDAKKLKEITLVAMKRPIP